MSARPSFKEITAELVHRLGFDGVLAYARSLGITTAGEVRPNGTISCHAILRPDDSTASAWLNLATAKYGDSGGDHKEIYLWEVAAQLGKAPSYKEAREHLAKSVGLTFNRKRLAGGGGFSAQGGGFARPSDRPPSPRKPLENWLDSVHPERGTQAAKVFILQFAVTKRGFSREAVVDAGGFFSTYPHGRTRKSDGEPMDAFLNVVGLPIYGQAMLTAETLDDSHAVGAAIWNKNATPFIIPREGQAEPETIKMKTVASADGLIGRHGLQAILDDRRRVAAGEPSTIERIWKVEGPTDLLALYAAMPAERRTREPIISTAGGSTSVYYWMADVVRGYHVVVCHDLDEAGEAGAVKTCETWGPAVRSISKVRLPGEVVEKHGADLRDFFLGGKTFDELDAQLLFVEPFEVTEAHREAAAKAVDAPPAATTTTTDSASDKPEHFSNARIIDDGEGGKIAKAKSLGEIDLDLRALTNDEPKRTGNLLFVRDGKRDVAYLGSAPSLFAFIGRATGMPVDWRKGSSFPTKEEAFAFQCANAPNYDTVEAIPHYPPRPRTFYTYQQPAGDGATLRKLLDRFCFETELDRDLFLAFVATLFWGGEGGCRPAFGFTSRDGRGSGKTTIVKMAALLIGGYLDVGQTEELENIKTRLLSTEGMRYRLAVIDNLKSHRFSSSSLEGLITSPTISGKRLFRGEGSRPNTVTWSLTLNGASLSKDMAQRTIFVHVRRPNRSGSWEEDTSRFILENRDRLIGDIAAFFQEPAENLDRLSRWAAWESTILARLPEPNDAQRLIEERQGDSDVDTEEAGSIEDLFAERLHGLGYDTAADSVHIPSAVGARWLSDALGEHKTPVSTTRIVKQQHNEGTLKTLCVNPTHANGRGLLWKPADCPNPVRYDLLDRLEHQRKSQLKEDAKARTEGARQASAL